MPFYEYQCEACHYEYEELQKMSDAPLTVCPKCHQPTFKKKISAAGFQLKGSGWYVTDFRDQGKPKTEAKSGETAASTTSTNKGTTE